MKHPIQHYFDILFLGIPILFCAIWLTQSFITIWATKNLYSGVNLFLFNNVHVVTVISVCIFYLLLFLTLDDKGIPIPMCVVTITLFISLGLSFNGIVWSTLNLFIGSRTGLPLLSIVSFVVILSFLLVLNRKYGVIQIHGTFLGIAIFLFIVTLMAFIQSGFFEAWRINELTGLVPDPHNWQWAIEQFVAVWMWFGIVKRR